MDRIRREGRVLPGGLLQVDGFVNHALDPDLTLAMGEAFAERFEALGVAKPDRIVTAEVSGIAPALATGMVVDAPVTFARKDVPKTLTPPLLQARSASRTKGGESFLTVSSERLLPGERVWIIDDFLARGSTLAALASLVHEADAQLSAVGVVIEKTFEGGRAALAHLSVPIVALAAVDALEAPAGDVPGRIDVREG